jgi:hypothetical protein
MPASDRALPGVRVNYRVSARRACERVDERVSAVQGTGNDIEVRRTRIEAVR